jgi:hypothetical protein
MLLRLSRVEGLPLWAVKIGLRVAGRAEANQVLWSAVGLVVVNVVRGQPRISPVALRVLALAVAIDDRFADAPEVPWIWKARNSTGPIRISFAKPNLGTKARRAFGATTEFARQSGWFNHEDVGAHGASLLDLSARQFPSSLTDPHALNRAMARVRIRPFHDK